MRTKLKSKTKMKTKALIVLLLFSVVSFAQTKKERETRVEKDVLPQAILTFVNQLPENTKRLRFYKEVDGTKESFETKFKYDGNHYSCEFDPNGKLEDIEKLIKEKLIEDIALQDIENHLETNFRKWKFLKIQEQYIPKPDVDSKVFLKTIFEKNSEISGYEIIIEVTKNKKRTLKEFQFDAKGKFINMRDIAPASYGHVLY